MRIDCVEIRNFRRLVATRIDVSETTTVFVGANNSGKTSAITALRKFLLQHDFSLYDIPLSLWGCIDALGELFMKSEHPESEVHPQWMEILPSLDVWLSVEDNEIHHVSHLIPTLDWLPDDGIGVRLQVLPRDSQVLLEAFSKATKAADDLASESATRGLLDGEGEQATSALPGKKTPAKEFALWPEDLIDYLKKHMASAMEIKAFLLDPALRKSPVNGKACPQALSADAEALEGHPLARLIRVDEVPAHRGLSDYVGGGESDEEGSSYSRRRQLLTSQLRSYYGKHLDPTKAPQPADIKALEAIYEAQLAFDERLRDSFKAPLDELQNLGYPGVANPRLVVSTNLKPVEGLNHQSAVQYDVMPEREQAAYAHRLPENCNGLGYQNLISMVFRLISFRDAWMKVGKASHEVEMSPDQETSPPPLHLVLLEEPEVHLHVQVQQVFIRKAYEVLRKHPSLAQSSPLATQLIVSTHSSHIAHEVNFAQMRYFRRQPARGPDEIPTSSVLNLSEVFGQEDKTARFVSRYLRASHADLFFADGVILAEGAAERLLVPHFIRSRFPGLHSSYVTLLEVGGSHAHRLAPLIEHLGVNTLIITDLDSVEAEGRHKKVTPQTGKGQLTANNVLKEWHPGEENLDPLLDLDAEKKEKIYDEDFSVRVAYQVPVDVKLPGDTTSDSGTPRTFEDALVLENIDLFRKVDQTGLLRKFKEAIIDSKNVEELSRALYKALDSGSKAAFALDVLYLEDLNELCLPSYIEEGLEWLQHKLVQRQREVQIDLDREPARKEKGD